MTHVKNQDIPVTVVCNTCQGVVPRRESSQETEKPASLDDRWVRHASLVAVEVSDTKQ